MPVSVLLKGLIFPAVFAGSIFGLERLLAMGVEPGLALFGTSVANLAMVMLLEIAFPLRREWSWWSDGQTVNDLIHGTLLSVAGPRLGEMAVSSAVTAGAALVAASTEGSGLWPAQWPLWSQVVLAVAATDFVDYGKHWLYHHWSVMWPIHALHHDVDRMHVTKGARLHFLEATIRYGIISGPLIVLGAGPEILLWYGAIMNFGGNLNHSNIDMPMPGFVHYLIASPQVHRLHHALDPDLGRSNLSPGFMLPDHVFGTFRHPDRYPLTEVGIQENPIPRNVVGQVLTPLIWPLLLAWHRRSLRRRMTGTTR